MKNAGVICQLFQFGQSECSVIMLWTYAVAGFTLTLWSTFFMWLVSWFEFCKKNFPFDIIPDARVMFVWEAIICVTRNGGIYLLHHGNTMPHVLLDYINCLVVVYWYEKHFWVPSIMWINDTWLQIFGNNSKNADIHQFLSPPGFWISFVETIVQAITI